MAKPNVVSKMVADRMAITATVKSSLEVHGPEVAPALEALLFPQGPPSNLTVAGFLQALQDVASRSREQIGAADLAHAAELSDDDAPRAAREEGLAALRATLIGLRSTMISTFGAPILAAYGIPSAIPEAADVLVRTAGLIEEQLRKRPISEAALQKGVSIDRIVIADEIQRQVAAVETAVSDVERERREAQLTLQAKNRALETWTVQYPGVADITTGCYELVGRQDLADVVRPTARRRAGLPEEQDAGSEEGGPPEGEG